MVATLWELAVPQQEQELRPLLGYLASADPMVATRLRTYYRFMLVWWVARFARSLYEVPRGLDQRLAARPATWQEETTAKYEHYLQRASGP